MVSEVTLFFVCEVILLVTFSSAFSCLHQDNEKFFGIDSGITQFFKMFMGQFTSGEYEELHKEAIVIFATFVYLICAMTFLLNMLIAQLSCAYDAVYADMVGFARLDRIRIIVGTVPNVSHKRWMHFLNALKFKDKLDFNDGDVGLAGGIQTIEPASAHPTAVDMIMRYGGSTSSSMPWPADASLEDEENDNNKFERMEKLLVRTMGRIQRAVEASAKYQGQGSSAMASSADLSGISSDTGHSLVSE
jgi:hypothetical protein